MSEITFKIMNKELAKNVSENIKLLRKYYKKTLVGLSQESFVHRNTIHNIEKNLHMPSLGKLDNLADSLKINYKYLFLGKSEFQKLEKRLGSIWSFELFDKIDIEKFKSIKKFACSNEYYKYREFKRVAEVIF